VSDVLSPGQIVFCEAQGYLVLGQRIPADWIARLCAKIARFGAEAAGIIAWNDPLGLDVSLGQRPRVSTTSRCAFRSHSPVCRCRSARTGTA
jgi:hypothetical protein